MVKAVHVAIVAVVAVALLIAGNYYGAFNLPTNQPQATPAPGGQANFNAQGNSNFAPDYGIFTMLDTATNSLSISSTLTLGSAVDQYWYAYRNNAWILLGVHGATGTNVEVTTADNGFIYVMCVPHTTSTYVLDAAKTLQMNPRVASVQWTDGNGDGTSEFMVKLSVANVPKPASGYPTTTFNAFYFYEDSANAALNTPFVLWNAGTSLNTTNVEWAITLGAVSRAVPFYKIQVKLNSTNPSEVTVKSILIPGIGTVSASGLTYWYDSSYAYYEYRVGTGQLGDCGFIKVGAQDPLKNYMTAQIQTITSENITCTMTVFMLSYADATKTTTTTVTVNGH